MGCKCPPEFYGPHCEFLSESLSSVRRGSQQPDEIQNPVTALAVFILSMGLMILAILYRCKQRFQIDETSQHSTQADNSVSTLSDWEAGKNNMTVSMAQAQVLSCDQSER